MSRSRSIAPAAASGRSGCSALPPPAMTPGMTAAELLPLFERLGRPLAERRMHLQVEHSATLFGAGRGGLHFENIHAIRTVLKGLLDISGLTGRARDNCVAYRVEQVAQQAGVDLDLCAHTHGGQICLPGSLPVIANASCGYRYLSASVPQCGNVVGDIPERDTYIDHERDNGHLVDDDANMRSFIHVLTSPRVRYHFQRVRCVCATQNKRG